MQTTTKEMIGKKVKVSYNSLCNEISRDEGVVYQINDDFLILELPNKKLKYISINKIVRVEEI